MKTQMRQVTHTSPMFAISMSILAHCSPALFKRPLLLCKCRGGARSCCCITVNWAGAAAAALLWALMALNSSRTGCTTAWFPDLTTSQAGSTCRKCSWCGKH